MFDQMVAPIISTSCAGSGCHSTAGSTPITFVVPPPQDLYASVLSYGDQLLGGNFQKADAQILTKIAGGHYATYTPQQVTDIGNWLDAEVAARSSSTTDGGVSTPPSPGRTLEAQWSGCMVQGEWDDAGVAVAWATKESAQGQCQQCHINGQGFLASTDSDRVFTILTTEANPTEPGNMFMDYYFVPDLTTDPAHPKMVINTATMQLASKGNAQHPQFTLNDSAMQALQSFYAETMAHLDAGTCGPPKFTP
jgi:hypothetical protein